MTALLVALLVTTQAPTQTLVAVPELTPLGVSAEQAQNLTAVIAAELGRYDHVRVISSREIVMLLGVERQKELLGCADESCITQLAGGMGAEKILSGQLGTVEQSLVFTLQLTDVRSARVDGRVVKVVPAGKNLLVDAVRAAVTSLMGTATSRNQAPRVSVRTAIEAHQRETVRLDASHCYDPDGDPLQIEWRQLDGPPALLETAREGVATFVASEVGHYTFRVSVTDGRSAPVVNTVEVDVLKLRPFSLGLGAQVFSPFNRFVTTDGVGGDFRNRVPVGPKLEIGLWLSEQWQLFGAGELGFMQTFTLTDGPNGSTLDYTAFNMFSGIRFYVLLGAFKLFAQIELGSSRLFLTVRQQDQVLKPNVLALMGGVSGGVDLPLTERWGLALTVGLRAQGNTEAMPTLPGNTFTFSPGGFYWGLQFALWPYLRL
ncbi:MAG: hypothetical protein JNK82_28835 [Myxococcaceae bacterium]|nr:hypothetical protein [Myxococcaceae bacterium]